VANPPYRPITDTWILARAKLKGGRKYYGAYWVGFPERARALLGVNINDPVLHVCGGMVKFYPYKRGFGPHDKTLDLDLAVNPDFLQNALDPLPKCQNERIIGGHLFDERPWGAILIDPPYSEADAAHYNVGAKNYPKPNALVKNAIDALPVGGRVGIVHYVWPKPPPNAYVVAVIQVLSGYNNRARIFSVYEKVSENV